MAVWNLDQGRREGGAGAGGRLGQVLRLTAAALSAGLVVGLGVWGYKLAMRQMHGIPRIAAPAGPARVAPDNPGGELALHQGLAVNAIAAVGTAAATADQLTLAPKPADLAADDTASDKLQAAGASSLALPQTDAAPPNRAVVPDAMAAALKPLPGQLSEPLPDNLSDPVDDPDQGVAGTDAAVAAALGIEFAAPDALDAAPATAGDEAQIAANVPGVAVSVIPALRAPRRIPAVAVQPEAVDIDADSLKSGTILAQIGSYETELLARQAWDAAASQFGPLMAGKARVIQQATSSGGRVFYRLRVSGFDSRDDARRFCAAFRSGGQCVAALVR